MNKIYYPIKLSSIIIVALIFEACSKQLDLSGTVTMEYAGTQVKSSKESYVFLLQDSVAIPYLEKRRVEFREELDKMKATQDEIYEKFDSLKTLIAKKEDKAIILQLDSIQSAAVSIKQKMNEFKHDYVVFTAKELAKKAYLTVKTGQDGVFGFDQLENGKYVLISIYDEKDHSGFMIKAVEFSGKPLKLSLDNNAIEPVLIYEPEK